MKGVIDLMRNVTKNQTDFLKLIATLFMIVDHVGTLFLAQWEIFSILGRISFPLFAFSLTVGMEYTTNRKRYLVRLWSFGLISQVPYTLLWDTTTLNIIFVLFASLLLMTLGKSYIGIFVLVGWFIPMDYGIYGIFLAPILYWLRNYKYLTFLVLTLMTIIQSYAYGWIQLYSLLVLFIVLYIPINWIPGCKLPKRFFYWFYPIHMLILFILKMIL